MLCPLAACTDEIDGGGGVCMIVAFFVAFVDTMLLTCRLPAYYYRKYSAIPS